MKKLLAVTALATLVACGSNSPTAPGVKSVSGHVSNSRYILISGAAPRPGCVDTYDGFQTC